MLLLIMNQPRFTAIKMRKNTIKAEHISVIILFLFDVLKLSFFGVLMSSLMVPLIVR